MFEHGAHLDGELLAALAAFPEAVAIFAIRVLL